MIAVFEPGRDFATLSRFLFECRTKINHPRHHVATKYEMSRVCTRYASSATHVPASLDNTTGQNQVDFSLQWANLIGTWYSVSFPRVALIVQGPDSRSNLFLPADKELLHTVTHLTPRSREREHGTAASINHGHTSTGWTGVHLPPCWSGWPWGGGGWLEHYGKVVLGTY